MVVESIRLKLLTLRGEEHDIEIRMSGLHLTPLDIRASEFLDEVVTALKLPKTDPAGFPVRWCVLNKDTGKMLEGEKTLEANGVQDGHRLLLRPPVRAC